MGWTKEELESAVKDSNDYASTLRKLNMVVSGGSYRVVKRYILKFSINTSHFHTIKRSKLFPKWTIENALIINSEILQSNLRKLILREKLLPYKCKHCGNEGLHNGKKLSLQLDHENGVRTDNRIENLRWLCPNCHSQTPTYSRTKGPMTKEAKRGRPAIRVDLICSHCRKDFQRLKSRVDYGKNANVKNVFCSNICKCQHWHQLRKDHEASSSNGRM